MLYRELLTAELDKQRDDFRRFSESQTSDLTDYLRKLKQLNQTLYAEIQEKLADKNAGAIPSDELEKFDSFSVSFANNWTNHEAARGWANETLKKPHDVCGRRQPALCRKGCFSANRRDPNRLV